LALGRIARATAAAALSLAAPFAAAQNPIAYPNRGQDAAQQTRDDKECRAQAGIADPARREGPQAGAGATAPRTAPAAVAGNGLTTDADRAAALGAGSRQAREAAAQDRRQAEMTQEITAAHQRGYATCMESRGYAVK
jgi:hypothetical protein